jgi:enoyl reductase-like protein
MEINKPEKEVPFVEADLKIIKPTGKHYMIRIDEPVSSEQSYAYDKAINEMADEGAKKMNVFHQVGSDDMSGPQAWEFWYPNDEKEIAAFVPEIHARARHIYESEGW